jgi:hypothetical protein
VHEQLVEQRGAVLEREAAARSASQLGLSGARGGEAMVGHPVGCAPTARAMSAANGPRPASRLGALGLGGAVEKQLGEPSAATPRRPSRMPKSAP